MGSEVCGCTHGLHAAAERSVRPERENSIVTPRRQDKQCSLTLTSFALHAKQH